MSYPPLPSSKDISTDQFLAYYVLYTPLVAYLALEPRRTPKFTPTPPSNLSDLNEIRFNSLPATLKERETKNGQAWINKEELQELVAWKLAHGTFRPTLPSLIASNPAQTVTKVTKAAFGRCKTMANDSHGTPLDILKDLSKLRGVGPATATLLLSVYKPNSMPFLSDELWRWVCWDEKAEWQKKIRYTFNEWAELCIAVNDLGKRIDAGALEVEKVAYVIGKFATTKGLETEIRNIYKECKAIEDPVGGEMDVEERIAITIENSEFNEAKEKGSKGLQSIRETMLEKKKKGELVEGTEETAEDKEETPESSKMMPATKGTSHPSTRSSKSPKGQTGPRKRKPTNTGNRTTSDSMVDAEPVSKRTRKR